MIQEHQIQLYMIKLYVFLGVGKHHVQADSNIWAKLDDLDMFNRFAIEANGWLSFRFVSLSRNLYSARTKRGAI